MSAHLAANSNFRYRVRTPRDGPWIHPPLGDVVQMHTLLGEPFGQAHANAQAAQQGSSAVP